MESLTPALFQFLQSNQWAALALTVAALALFVLATVSGVRATLAHLWPWLATDRAGVVLSALAGPLGGVLSAIATGMPLSQALVFGVLSSVTASGAYSWKRKGLSAQSYCTPDQIAAGTCKP